MFRLWAETAKFVVVVSDPCLGSETHSASYIRILEPWVSKALDKPETPVSPKNVKELQVHICVDAAKAMDQKATRTALSSRFADLPRF